MIASPVITGKTGLLAVIGHPVSHSLSPQIHNHWLTQTGLPYAYLAFDIPSGSAGAFLQAARLLNITGFNVTMPLKAEILPLLDKTDSQAALFGAVNTVILRDGRFEGYNTDGEGFWLSLRQQKSAPSAGNALILGAGGAAKTIAITLMQKGFSVCVASRRPHTLESLGVTACRWERLGEACANCSLLVNATPLGMRGHDGDFSDLSFLAALPSNALVYDLIYAPRETTLLRAAKSGGLATANGLSHLICQAALSFAIFTGIQPPQQDIDALNTLL